ncbi:MULTISPECIES: DUF4398 domain-containing protein [Nannocystis]|uniref:DUF4398 domain-containing protein n=1 Tax=Nannocystis radixulma TaxID=2995305 RepID=A0ABT5BGX7_9BACT|nr:MULTISPECIES: DUF4398 domain-containing protein [Nannocystis]MCY1056486.1 DUF4398 domain-containing protein [Nannocystis sp. SCPEA4]MDC0673391.1 DUF4398 domain-containing protein [Nannocystis radixulma]
MRAPLFSLVFVFFAVGCATAPAKQAVNDSIATVNTAEQLGASEVPQAAKALDYAQHEVAWAKALLINGRHERALLMAQRAESDAALAIVIVRQHKAREAVEQAATPGTTAPNP